MSKKHSKIVNVGHLTGLLKRTTETTIHNKNVAKTPETIVKNVMKKK